MALKPRWMREQEAAARGEAVMAAAAWCGLVTLSFTVGGAVVEWISGSRLDSHPDLGFGAAMGLLTGIPAAAASCWIVALVSVETALACALAGSWVLGLIGALGGPMIALWGSVLGLAMGISIAAVIDKGRKRTERSEPD